MSRALAGLASLLVLCPAALADGPQKGVIKSVDAGKAVVTITSDGKDLDITVPDDAKLMGADRQPLADGLKNKGLKAGAAVMFKAQPQDGKLVLEGLLLGGDDKGPSPPGGDIRRGVLKSVEKDKGLVTITADGKDLDFAVTDDTKLFAPGPGLTPLPDRLKDDRVKAGAPVMFKTATRDGKTVLDGLKIGGGDDKGPPERPPLEKVDTSKLMPLTEMGDEKYQGDEGGLYPGGKNERPADHEKAGKALAKTVRPLDASGKPDPDGKIVVMSVGMSNTVQAFDGFMRAAKGDDGVNPKVQLVNGAMGGMTAKAIQDPDDNGSGTKYWKHVDDQLKAAGVTREQVQVVWIKQADAGPTQGFPKYAQTLEGELEKVVQVLHARSPNVKLVYLSSRTYGGYAKTRLNPEPYAYESGFSVKWLIENQIKGEADLNYDPAKRAVKAPWLSWGPYLWANGSSRRADGFSYDESDFSSSDGTHESEKGQAKIGKELLKFFKADSTTKDWFLAR
jgi:hypothetical protein